MARSKGYAPAPILNFQDLQDRVAIVRKSGRLFEAGIPAHVLLIAVEAELEEINDFAQMLINESDKMQAKLAEPDVLRSAIQYIREWHRDDPKALEMADQYEEMLDHPEVALEKMAKVVAMARRILGRSE
jgi:hypothetical protein